MGTHYVFVRTSTKRIIRHLDRVAPFSYRNSKCKSHRSSCQLGLCIHRSCDSLILQQQTVQAYRIGGHHVSGGTGGHWTSSTMFIYLTLHHTIAYSLYVEQRKWKVGSRQTQPAHDLERTSDEKRDWISCVHRRQCWLYSSLAWSQPASKLDFYLVKVQKAFMNGYTRNKITRVWRHTRHLLIQFESNFE